MNDDARDARDNAEMEEQAERDALIASYALGGATVAEAEQARHFIAHDPDAARLYEEFAAIAAVLPEIYADTDMDAISATPSATLKDRVLAAARAEMEREQADTPKPATPVSKPISLASVREQRRAPWYAGWIAAAALLIAVVGLGVWNINLHRDVQQASRDRDVVRLAANAKHAYTMTGTQNAPAANATLIESAADGGQVVLLAQGFPYVTAGQTYRIWLQKQDGSFADVGTFRGGGGQTTLVLPGNLNGIHAVVITAEPEAKSATRPTGTPVMEGELTV